jgi:hypothetical protein
MTDPITSILDARLPQPGTDAWKKLPPGVRDSVELGLEFRTFLPDSLVPELDAMILERLIPHALQEECPPEG